MSERDLEEQIHEGMMNGLKFIARHWWTVCEHVFKVISWLAITAVIFKGSQEFGFSDAKYVSFVLFLAVFLAALAKYFQGTVIVFDKICEVCNLDEKHHSVKRYLFAMLPLGLVTVPAFIAMKYVFGALLKIADVLMKL